MFLKRLNYFFLSITILGSIFLVYSWINTYNFKKNPLDEKIVKKVKEKQYYLEKLSYQKFGINRKIPLIISDKMPSKLFGAATYSKNGQISIYLNKKRFKESSEYMINDVLPHEYAHALMFVKGYFTDENGGHSKQWQNICIELEGINCNRFVDHDDVIMGKSIFF
jgi:hypothetical protein